MLVLNWDRFAECPAGTAFSFWIPCIADDLCVKDDTLFVGGHAEGQQRPVDFWYQSLLPTPESEGSEVPVLEEGLSRWGLFDYDQLFAVYEPDDIKRLIGYLTGD